MNKHAMNQEKIIKPYDTVIQWTINHICNFKCVYCNPSLNSNKKYNNYSDKFEHFFENTDKIFRIIMTGGEPFLYPRFVELCEKITKKHYIHLITNLTSNKIYDFTERTNPERVGFIDCAVHIDERERIGGVEDFVNKFLLLRQKGFNVVATQVAYPSVLERFNELYRFFGNHGITLFPKIFNGWYKCHYPQDYTKKERDKINFYLKLSESELQRVKTYYGPYDLGIQLTHGSYSWRGLPCKAGKDFIYLEHGTFTRCMTDKERLGSVTTGELKLHKKLKECNADICQCPSHGLKFAIGKPTILYRIYNTRELVLIRHMKSYLTLIINKLLMVKNIFKNIQKITADE